MSDTSSKTEKAKGPVADDQDATVGTDPVPAEPKKTTAKPSETKPSR